MLTHAAEEAFTSAVCEMEPDIQPQGVQEQRMEFQWSDGTGDTEFSNLLGRCVRLKGLQARPELNGRIGTVMVWDENAERAGVDIAGSEHLIAVRPANIEEVPRGTKEEQQTG